MWGQSEESSGSLWELVSRGVNEGLIGVSDRVVGVSDGPNVPGDWDSQGLLGV